MIDQARKYFLGNLNSNSVVFDIGGYHGDWAKYIYDTYHCNLYIFEPVKVNYNIVCNNMQHLSKVHIFKTAISDVDGKIGFFLTANNDGCSLYDRSKNKKIVNKVSVSSCTLYNFMKQNNIDYVDLIKMNIEGSEYNVIKTLDEELASKIHQITFSSHVNKIISQEQHDFCVSHLRKLGYKVTSYSNEQVKNRFYAIK